MLQTFSCSVFFCVYIAFLFLVLRKVVSSISLLECHDDPTYQPRVGPIHELQFTWLATLQYIHIKNGTPHYFRVPRVVLVARQYVLCIAHDAALVPTGYALGNIVFGEYERDEHECGLTVGQVAGGMPCDPAMMVMPIADVIMHPDYRKFGAMHSVALLRLLTPVLSKYMLPVCLPLSDHLINLADQRITSETMYHVDYASPVPRVFVDESKQISMLSLLPDDMCTATDLRGNRTEAIIKTQQICTTGCGLHSGAPSIVHEATGHWTLIALSLGGSWCDDPLVYRRPSPPPHHQLIFPYVNWITNTITGRPSIVTLTSDPFGSIVPRATHYQRHAAGWVGHWWMGGINCYDRAEANVGYFRFYHEIFTLHPEFVTNLTYYIEFFPPKDISVRCVKVGMPIQLATPKVWDLKTSHPKLRIPIRNVTYKFRFEVEAYGLNMTPFWT